MRIAILLVAIILTGCATQPVPRQKELIAPSVVIAPVVLDEKCAELAKYVRAIAILRDINVPIDDVNYVLPKQPNYPIGTIQRSVYYKIDNSPTMTSVNVYKECVSTGYTAMMTRYETEEIIFNHEQEELVRAALERKKTYKKKPVKK
jgi:hypothetical protein